jgi:hypothetical protein
MWGTLLKERWDEAEGAEFLVGGVDGGVRREEY